MLPVEEKEAQEEEAQKEKNASDRPSEFLQFLGGRG
jgi:hypothetical protein